MSTGPSQSGADPVGSSDVTSSSVVPPAEDRQRRWLGLTEAQLPVGAIHDWCILPECGAVVVFSGTVRDHADHRTGVTLLEYEAYESQVVPKLAAIEQEIRARFLDIGRIALLHRVGPLALEDVSVVVAVSAAHRPAAFDAARFGIDALKATVPIWKRETWTGGPDGVGGHDWGLAATAVGSLDEVPSPGNQLPPLTGAPT